MTTPAPRRRVSVALIRRQGEFLPALDGRSGAANTTVPPETPAS